jgi:hypothetical protein
MKVSCKRHVRLRICWRFLVMLLLPAITAAQQPAPAPPPGSGGTADQIHAIAGPNQKIGVRPGYLAFATLDGSKSYDSKIE